MKNWKDLIRSVAPSLATALGGPLAGVAVREIAGKILGKPNASEDDVAVAMASASPETLLKLRELDQEFSKHMAELGVELEKLDASDRKDARARQVAMRDWTPNVLAMCVVAVFFLAQWHLFHNVVPETMKELVARLLGTIDAMVMLVLSYFFGSSRGSRAKDELLAKKQDN